MATTRFYSQNKHFKSRIPHVRQLHSDVSVKMLAYLSPSPGAVPSTPALGSTMRGFRRRVSEVVALQKRTDLDRWPVRHPEFPIEDADTAASRAGASRGGALGAYGGCIALWIEAQQPRPSANAARASFSGKHGLWTTRVKVHGKHLTKKKKAAIELLRSELLADLKRTLSNTAQSLLDQLPQVVADAEHILEKLSEDRKVTMHPLPL